LNVDIKVLKAIRRLRILLPDIEACTAAWDANMFEKVQGNERDHYLRQRMRTSIASEPAVRISMCSEEACAKFLEEAETFAPLRRRAAAPFDVLVKVFLRYGCRWLVDCVISIDSKGDRTTINTSDGLDIELEASCSVSPVATVNNRWSVSMPEGSVSGFTSTITMPPGCSYRVFRVEDVSEKKSDKDWTVIETAGAVFEVGEGNYGIRRVNVGSRVIVENLSGATRCSSVQQSEICDRLVRDPMLA
jgi:hypothetical protein